MAEHAVSLSGGPRDGTVEYVGDPWPREGHIHVTDGIGGTAKYKIHHLGSGVWEGVYVPPGQGTDPAATGTEGEPGPTGPAGVPGPQGIQGPPGEDGTPLRHRGAWAGGTVYVILDCVTFNGSSYVSKIGPNVGIDPVGHELSPDAWGLMASKGDTGDIGATGATGDTGLEGPEGPTGPEGPEGPAGADGGGSGSFSWMGDWDVGTAYAENDLVYFDGSTWRASGDVSAGVEPGGVAGDPEMATGTFKAGGGGGGTDRAGFALIENVPMTERYPAPSFPGGVNFAPVGGVPSSFYKLVATPASSITITSDQGIGVFDGSDGTALSGLSGPQTSPLTLTVPASGNVVVESPANATTILFGNPDEGVWLPVAIKGVDGVDGEAGAEGPTGPEGPEGPEGPPGADGSGGGGGGASESVLLDEDFATDTSSAYTIISGPALNAASGYLKLAATGDTYARRNDIPADVRNPLVAIEWLGNDGSSGTPLFAIQLREQSDRFIHIQMHSTSLAIYTSSPTHGSYVQRALTSTSGFVNKRGWLVASVFEDQVLAVWSQQHPTQMELGTAIVASYDLGSLSDFNTDAHRIGSAGVIRLAAPSDVANQRIYHHQIYDLDQQLLGAGAGPIGPEGPPGADGADGVGGDAVFVYTQAVPNSTWVVAHSLGKYPAVIVVDSALTELEAEVSYTDVDNLTITFSGPTAGTATLN